jgi:hypothetical protein
MPPRNERSTSVFHFLTPQKPGMANLGRDASKSVGSKPDDQSAFVKTPTISEKSYSPGEEKVISAVFAGFLNQRSFVVMLEGKDQKHKASQDLIAEHIKFIQAEGLTSKRLDSSGKPESMGELLTRTASTKKVVTTQGDLESLGPKRELKENPPILHLTTVLELVNNYEAYLRDTTVQLEGYDFALKPAWQLLSDGLNLIENELSSGEMNPLDDANKKSLEMLKKSCSEKITDTKDDIHKRSPRSFNGHEDERNRCLPTMQAAQSLRAMAAKFSPSGNVGSNPFSAGYSTELYQKPMNEWMEELSKFWGIEQFSKDKLDNLSQSPGAETTKLLSTQEKNFVEAFIKQYDAAKNKKGVFFFGNSCEDFKSIVKHAAGLNRRGLFNTGMRSANILINLFEKDDRAKVKKILADMRKNRSGDLSSCYTQLIELYAKSGHSTAHNSAHLHAPHNSDGDASPSQLRASELRSAAGNSNSNAPKH